MTFNSHFTLSALFIDIECIESKIKSLDGDKGAGPDGLPPRFVKNCCDSLSLPLYIIFNKSLKSGTFPTYWKIAHVIPIHKSGCKDQCDKYRPISILSCFAKLFESVTYPILYSFLKSQLSIHQHGFIANRSTISNLLEYKNYLCSAFARRMQVDSIYTDFAKAFDKVNHAILCQKLEVYGIHGSLLRWFTSYLGNRSQLVSLQGHLSSPVTITSGVPQGSHLGPLLFLLFINDLVQKLTVPCLLYADDLKIFLEINNLNDCVKLQQNLSLVAEWCSVNKMSLNCSKCFVISFGSIKRKLFYNYTLDNYRLERQSVIRDLGVYFDENLSFHNHYDYIISKCNQLLGFISRSTKEFKNQTTFIYLYNSLIRSVIEYGCIIWSPFYKTHSERIEKIQKKFLSILVFRLNLGRKYNSYHTRLQHFNMSTLACRRNIQELICLHKIVHSEIDSPILLSQLNFNTRFKSRSPIPRMFTLQVYKNNTSYYNPIIKMCRLYNETVLEHSSLDVFGTNLVKFRREILSIFTD